MTRPSHSQRLRRRIDLGIGRLTGAAERLWSHDALGELYPRYLHTMHGVVRASVPLMRRCVEACEARGDELSRALAPYMIQHIPEETGHERWITEDLEVLGIPARSAEDQVPGSTVAALVGAQYYWMAHVHPCALLGYIAILEGYPIHPDQARALPLRSGLPAAAFNALIRHADLDPGHRDELDRLLDRLPLDDRLLGLIGLSALTTVELSAQALDEVVEQGAW